MNDHDTALPSLLLAGCGKMGGAMLKAWIARGLAPSVILDRHADALPSPHQLVRQAQEIPADFRPRAIILASKPQKSAALIESIGPFVGDALVISVMAGCTTATLGKLFREAALGAPDLSIIRTMPNTPAAIGQAMSVSFAGTGVTQAQRVLCDRLMSAIGEQAWVESEAQIDAVTAVSGSGPAYVFLLAELLEKCALEQGLPAPLARQIARKTVSGAGALIAAGDTDAAELRRQVTSPNGTTERALNVLMHETALPDILSRAVDAATQRARELAT